MFPMIVGLKLIKTSLLFLPYFNFELRDEHFRHPVVSNNRTVILTSWHFNNSIDSNAAKAFYDSGIYFKTNMKPYHL
jgi:hypothetical protein